MHITRRIAHKESKAHWFAAMGWATAKPAVNRDSTLRIGCHTEVLDRLKLKDMSPVPSYRWSAKLGRVGNRIKLLLSIGRKSKVSRGILATSRGGAAETGRSDPLARLAKQAGQLWERFGIQGSVNKIWDSVSTVPRTPRTLAFVAILSLCFLWLQATGFYYCFYKDGGNKLIAVFFPPYAWFKGVELTYRWVSGELNGAPASSGPAPAKPTTPGPSPDSAKQAGKPEQLPRPVPPAPTPQRPKAARSSPFETPPGVRDSAEASLKARSSAGDIDAQYELGLLYAKGDGVPQDDKIAVEWFRQAAEQGDPRSQNALGKHYAEARGTPEDPEKAVELFRAAAEKGYPSAAYNLGVMYELGRGVPKDNVAAIVWYRKAASQGDADAKKALDTFQDRKHE